jgi:glutathione S-transferase
MSSAVVYLDLMSQPSRAVALFIRAAALRGVEEAPVLIHKRQHRTQEHMRRNPLAKVPVLEVQPEGAQPAFTYVVVTGLQS